MVSISLPHAVVAVLSLAAVVGAFPPPPPPPPPRPPLPHPNPSCIATPDWPGWSSIKHAFIFGDSYTTTGFNDSLTQPTATSPLGNPTYPGYTSSNGPNWVDYLTTTYNDSFLLTYDLAYGGATVDSALVAPYLPTVSSVAEQVENEFFPVYAAQQTVKWDSSDSLFAVFIGINDVGNSYAKGQANSTVLNTLIFKVLGGLVDMLYETGARNFLLLNVPPVQRSPLTTAQGNASVNLEKADIEDWNNRLKYFAEILAKKANVFTFDTNALFNKVLDDPKAFPQTSGYLNTTQYCDGYASGTPTQNYFNATCGIPVNEYFWLNSLHPTYPMHDVLAQQVAKTLEAGPNVC